MHVGLYKLPHPKLFLQLMRASKSYFCPAENTANMQWRDVEFSCPKQKTAANCSLVIELPLADLV